MKTLKHILQPVISAQDLGATKTEVSELWGGSRGLFVSALLKGSKRPVVVVVSSNEQAEKFKEDLNFFLSRTEVHEPDSDGLTALSIPSWNTLPFSQDSPDSGTIGERMKALYHLISNGLGIYVVPVGSLMQKLPPKTLFVDAVTAVSQGTEMNPDRLADRLVSMGYEPSSTVTRIGEFSKRGGIFDFFSPLYDRPVRIEFFGDTVESIREFELESQRSAKEIRHAVAIPVREIIRPAEALGHKARDRHLLGVEDSLSKGLASGDIPPGAEFLAPLLYEMEPLTSYLPTETFVVLNEPEDILKTANEFWQKAVSGREEEAGQGRFLPDVEELYLVPSEIEGLLGTYKKIYLTLIPSNSSAVKMGTISPASLGVRLARFVKKADDTQEKILEGSLAGLVQSLRSLQEKNIVTLVCSTEESSLRLKKMLEEYGLAITSQLQTASETPSPIYITTGRLSQGFLWPRIESAYITEEDIFGRKAHRPVPRAAKVTPFLSTFKELRPGDFVVHRDYGVGEYQGLAHINVDGFETDYLAIRYEPDAKLYVPLYSLDKVQKYIGIEGTAPKLDRLGAPQWTRTKEKVRKDILEMARELVNIYAAREAMERRPFSAPDILYREFEASFPHEETPDQERAIEEVLADMQRPRPMDRLVCGDVGYGKTEVALRAAFKALEDGFQTAVLVPTTILADQHFRTFSSRLERFSAKVEMLSRFRSKAEQKEILRGLKDGTIDIIIGTHRLLQRDVSFRNLGLLIVDEEHRFGVKHKERIKEFKKLVDVLTLTATPIPRTLHMSLSGLRDLSVIQTPPLDRQAIQVVLARFGPRIIKEAVTSELNRGGRVFFVHNRVQGIERMAEFIKKIVPEAKVAIAHGQMQEQQIEDAMSAFIRGEVNVLVTTTIIESGIDIPEANTIIINRADRFGLAELYQIKGRVGRGREKAFAYLLIPPDESLSETAKKRLRALQELSELGAGFRIAAQDLETRGAGNLLGKQQSGHIAAVGIDLYTEMMEEAISELKGQPIEKRPDTQINLRVSAFIPETYIQDMGLRLAAYKQISAISNEEEADILTTELTDRYGRPPEPARNLIDIMRIKAACRAASVLRVDQGASSVSLTFSEDASIPPDRVMSLLKRNKGRISLVSEFTLKVEISDGSLASVSEAVKKSLQELM